MIRFSARLKLLFSPRGRSVIRVAIPILLFAVVLSAVRVASEDDHPAVPPPKSITDLNGDNIINAADLILLLENWEENGLSVSDLVQIGEAWQSNQTDTDTPTPTLPGDLFTPTPTNETRFNTPTPTLPGDLFTPTPTNETSFNTPTPTAQPEDPTVTPRPTRTPTGTPVDPELFYYYQGRKIYLTPSDSRIAVIFEDGVSSEERDAFLARHPELSSFTGTCGVLWEIDMSHPIPWGELKNLLDAWADDPEVRYVTFGYVTHGRVAYVLDEFGAKIYPAATPEEVDSFNELNQVEILVSGFLPHRDGWFVLRPIGVQTALETIRKAILYHESDLFEFGSPDLACAGGGLKTINKTAAADTEYFYYFWGRPMPLEPHRSRIGIRFRPDVNDHDISKFVSDHSDFLAPSIPERFGSTGMKIVNLNRSLSSSELADSLSGISVDSRLELCSPVFVGRNGSERILTGSFEVKFPAATSPQEIASFLKSKGVEVLESGELPHRHGTYILAIPGAVDGRQALAKANEFVESGKVEYASPDFMMSKAALSTTPNDSLFNDQWHLQNIDAPEGWDLQTGSSSIVIAILDSGIDLDHPDLDSHIWVNPGESPTPNGTDDDSNGYVDDINGWDFIHDEDQEPDVVPDDDYGHGTAVAGLAAAETNNGIGVAGVSWASKLMALKIMDSDNDIIDLQDVADAIRYASDNGAHVLNHSFYCDEDHRIWNAIANARRSGRGGKGCVLVGAAGNGFGQDVSFPAFLDQMISVGATKQDDTKWDYSDYGAPLDVMAPSGDPNVGRVLTLVTTDMVDTAGYNDAIIWWATDDYGGNQEYTKYYSGTSASCPQVAGLAALLLSQNPNLTAGEVQSLIQASADDIPDTGWDEETGWGRINLYNALATATAAPVGRFELKDEATGEGVAFDEHGYLYLSGRLKTTRLPWPDYTPIPTPNPNKTEFYILNANQTPVALVDIAEGDLYIGGMVYIRQIVPTPNPNKGEFYLRNAQATPVAMINEDGDLYLERQYYNESYP